MIWLLTTERAETLDALSHAADDLQLHAEELLERQEQEEQQRVEAFYRDRSAQTVPPQRASVGLAWFPADEYQRALETWPSFAEDYEHGPYEARQKRNRDGRHWTRPGALADKMRQWVGALEELVGPDGEAFDRAKVFPYAFRHSYAQRLADEGASESELMDLMDHDSFETTRGYFRIRAERRRRAAELGRKALFDNQGRRLMRGLEHLAEAEPARMEMGSLTVPYGACVESANVASMGGACDFMLKCLGCKHFRTDLSHLPALESYERQLIAARERLLAEAEVGALEGWARAAALPSQEEIDRVRYLIRRIRDTIGELEPAERAELEALFSVERSNRSAILERLPARHELNVLNVGAVFDGAAS